LDTKVALQGRLNQRAATLPLPEGSREPASVEYRSNDPTTGPLLSTIIPLVDVDRFAESTHLVYGVDFGYVFIPQAAFNYVYLSVDRVYEVVEIASVKFILARSTDQGVVAVAAL
jgi:hypothetical protein